MMYIINDVDKSVCSRHRLCTCCNVLMYDSRELDFHQTMMSIFNMNGLGNAPNSWAANCPELREYLDYELL